jgi:hypothetical protein
MEAIVINTAPVAKAFDEINDRLNAVSKRWRRERPTVKGSAAYFYPERCLQVIVSVERQGGDELWLHLSVSRQRRLPDWDDLKLVRDVFLGPETPAVQVLAPASEWVNVHENCLHLWSLVDKGDAVLAWFLDRPKGTN